ncbi:hypothetical protein [Lysobacter olei]
MARHDNSNKQLAELLYQMLETELGGEQVYQMAIRCAVNDDLKKEWQEYLDQTRHHQEVVLRLFEHFGLDPKATTPGREVVGHIGRSLVQAMEMAKANATKGAAELVACECVVMAETKDHSNWELLGRVAQKATGEDGRVLRAAHEEVEQEEDHHLYHSAGWLRELWIDNLGMPAVLPPPEEVKQVETAIGASRAEQARSKML